MAPVAEGVDQVTSSSGADGSRDEAKMQTMRQQEDEEGGGRAGRERTGRVTTRLRPLTKCQALSGGVSA